MNSAKTALITGGGSGIGAASARRLARRGFHLALFGRTLAKLKGLVPELKKLGAPSCLIFAGDQESGQQVRDCVDSIDRAWSRIDLLFNNAGVFSRGSVLETPLSDWQSMLSINLFGPLNFSREIVPIMRRNGGGLIINTASTLGLRPAAGSSAYAVSKAALIALTRCLALEEAEHGIRAVAICPGVVDTPIHGSRSLDPESRAAQLAEMAKLHPLGRIGTADEVAALVEFLADSENSWITGSEFVIDGGISLR